MPPKKPPLGLDPGVETGFSVKDSPCSKANARSWQGANRLVASPKDKARVGNPGFAPSDDRSEEQAPALVRLLGSPS
jgi:hypothetical protein